jgi:hypothetical protein
MIVITIVLGLAALYVLWDVRARLRRKQVREHIMHKIRRLMVLVRAW